MEFVVKEQRRPFKWYFDTERLAYVRHDENGKENAFMLAEHIPNPGMIKERFRLIRQTNPKFARTDADPVTYALWNHNLKRTSNA